MDNIIEHYISIFYVELDYLEFLDLDKDKRKIPNKGQLGLRIGTARDGPNKDKALHLKGSLQEKLKQINR